MSPRPVESLPLDIRLGTWIHVAARRSGNIFELLLNGDVIAREIFADDEGVDLDAPAPLKFGHRGGPEDTPGTVDPGGFFLHGRIDEVELIIGRALSDEEIGAVVDAGATRRCAIPPA